MDILATHLPIAMQLTTEQRVCIAKQYYSSCSPTKVKREFNNVVDKWRRNGNICNLNKGNSGRPTHVGTVIANFEKQINLCIEQPGGHFAHCYKQNKT